MLFFELLVVILYFLSYFKAYQSYVQHRSCSPPNLSSLLFSWFSLLN